MKHTNTLFEEMQSSLFKVDSTYDKLIWRKAIKPDASFLHSRVQRDTWRWKWAKFHKYSVFSRGVFRPRQT